jgi:hypothetical protein
MGEPTFASLDQLLVRLGFTKRVVPGVRVVFERPGTEEWIALRPYRDDDAVEPAGLGAVRSQLDAWGLMGRDEFDEQMRQRSLAG